MMVSPRTAGRVVLIADDSEEDRYFARSSLLSIAGDLDIREVVDGIELLDYLRADTPETPFPDLIFLDLKMPRMDGMEALDAIRADPSIRWVPIVAVYTSASDPQFVREAYANGANAFVGKPASHDEMIESMRTIVDHWFGIASLPTHQG